MAHIEWLNSSQTLLRIDNRIINLANVTQIILNEKLSETASPHVTLYFGVPIGNSLESNNVPSWAESDATGWWLTYKEEDAESLRAFFGFPLKRDGALKEALNRTPNIPNKLLEVPS
jgi:hypothetical protein